MATTTTAGTKFKPELVKEMFDKVKGHSALARLNDGDPIPFAGKEVFVFSMNGEAAIVGEGDQKPAGDASLANVTIVPVKFIYQHRVTDEFVHMAEEKQLEYLRSFMNGFAKKIARGMDIAYIHGVNPATGQASALIGQNNFDSKITQTVTYDSAKPDENIDDAAGLIQDKDCVLNGVIMAPAFATALGKMTDSNDNHQYPEYRFGGNPGRFAGLSADVSSTVSFGSSADRAIVGDFENAFSWGYAEDISFEIIEYGDPDGQGDLKRQNQIELRSEAYIGWGILDGASFARITDTVTAGQTS
jgi:HK97 family phage major capsid protein